MRGALLLLLLLASECETRDCPPVELGYLDRLGLGIVTNIPTIEDDGSTLCAVDVGRLEARFPRTWTSVCWTSGLRCDRGTRAFGAVVDLGGDDYRQWVERAGSGGSPDAWDAGLGPAVGLTETDDGVRLCGRVTLRCSPGFDQPADVELAYCVAPRRWPDASPYACP